MLANAEQAIEKLRHKRTGEVLTTKNIARNTKLIYLHDEAVGLRFHETIIAKYLRDGVLLDTRDRFNPQGWFTVTTWNRINEWTPARTGTRQGLRYIATEPGTRESLQLYTHGTFVHPDGHAEIPMDPATSEAIAYVNKAWPLKLKRYAEHVVKLWREWAEPPKCCREAWDTESAYAHTADHVRTHDYAVPPNFERDFVTPLRPRHDGDALASKASRDFTDWLRSSLIRHVVKQIDPAFPYPQLTKH